MNNSYNKYNPSCAFFTKTGFFGSYSVDLSSLKRKMQSDSYKNFIVSFKKFPATRLLQSVAITVYFFLDYKFDFTDTLLIK